MEDIVREPVELIDEDLDVVAGGQGGNQPPPPTGPNIKVVHQFLFQTGLHSETATNVSSVSQP
jgi:hypothetical protein